MTRLNSVLGTVLIAFLAACGGAPEAEAPEQQTQAAAPAQEPVPEAQRPEGQQGQPASPRDTAETRIADDRIFVDYGRPSMRGRKIMGGLVPYGQVWRTGANEATHLVTTRDLRIGDTTVPAGTYTIYTLPAENEWQLIINKQTGQWGTEYSQAQDLARIPMRVEQMGMPVEQFTITLEPGGGNVLNLVMAWENTRATVPMELVHPAAG